MLVCRSLIDWLVVRWIWFVGGRSLGWNIHVVFFLSLFGLFLIVLNLEYGLLVRRKPGLGELNRIGKFFGLFFFLSLEFQIIYGKAKRNFLKFFSFSQIFLYLEYHLTNL